MGEVGKDYEVNTEGAYLLPPDFEERIIEEVKPGDAFMTLYGAVKTEVLRGVRENDNFPEKFSDERAKMLAGFYGRYAVTRFNLMQAEAEDNKKDVDVFRENIHLLTELATDMELEGITARVSRDWRKIDTVVQKVSSVPSHGGKIVEGRARLVSTTKVD